MRSLVQSLHKSSTKALQREKEGLCHVKSSAPSEMIVLIKRFMSFVSSVRGTRGGNIHPIRYALHSEFSRRIPLLYFFPPNRSGRHEKKSFLSEKLSPTRILWCCVPLYDYLSHELRVYYSFQQKACSARIRPYRTSPKSDIAWV